MRYCGPQIAYQMMPTYHNPSGRKVLLSVMIAGRSNTNSEQQEENSVDDSEYFQGISGCAVIYDESSNTYSLYGKEKCEKEVSPLSTFKIILMMCKTRKRYQEMRQKK
ncbi:MAG: hypothetical protein HFI53_11450 [Lachnospiraceae bacterium]|nr:hypothetical protein [Lachnospiraceae bacterium]